MLPPDSAPAAMSVAEDEGHVLLPRPDDPGFEVNNKVNGISPRSPRTRDSDAVSVISAATSTKSSKSKKRVQFLPEGQMVRIRVIPPRSNKSSSESDGSASETSSESDDSDSDTEDSSASSRTPSPATPTHSLDNEQASMPPIVWSPGSTAKGSYALSKSGIRAGNTVARITGIRPTLAPSPTVPTPSPTPRRVRRTPSPKLEKRARKTQPKTPEKAAVSVSVRSLASPGKSRPQRKSGQARKDGKTSPPALSKASNSRNKQLVGGKNTSNSPTPISNSGSSSNHNSSCGSNTNNSIRLSASASKMPLSQRRVSSAPITKSSADRLRMKQSPSSFTSTSKAISQSLNDQHQQQQQQHQHPPGSMDKVGRAMQSLTMGQLYTIDGFIFPSHQSPEVHLPDVFPACKGTEDPVRHSFGVAVPSLRGGVSGSNRLSSPRRSLDLGILGRNHAQTSPTSAARKKRQAWQMAEGGAQTTLHNSLSIAQLWDQPGDD